MRKPSLQKRTTQLAWDDLRLVLEIVRGGSLSAAARALSLEHSTVFRRLVTVEQRLGVSLFERSRSGYSATADGEAVAAAARTMEAAAHEAERRVLGADTRLTGTVRLACSEMFAHYLLPEVLGQFLAEHTAMEIELCLSTQSVDLTRREADLALRASNAPSPHLYGSCIGEIRYGIYAHQQLLAATATPPALSELPWLGHDSSIAHLEIARWQETRLPQMRPRLRFDSILALTQAAAHGLGAAILPSFAAMQHPALYRVGEILDQPRMGLWVLHHRDVRQSARVRALSRHLIQSVPQQLKKLVTPAQ